MEHILDQNPRIHFVAVQRSSGRDDTSQRIIELADADARSHAARVSHQRKKNTLRVKRSVQSGESGQFFGTKYGPYQTTAYISSGLLDPFVQLPCGLTLTERNFLHDYFIAMSKTQYNTAANSAFCPVRDITLVSVATNEIWLHWTILQRHHLWTQQQGRDPEKDQLLLHRKQHAYRLMSERLAGPIKEVLSLETIYALTAAGVGELRMSGARKANQHLEAGLMLTEMRQKRELSTQFTDPGGQAFVCVYIGIGVDNFFKHYVMLTTTGSSLLEKINSMQTWNRELRQRVVKSSNRHAVENEHRYSEFMTVRAALRAKDSIIRGCVRCLCAEHYNYNIRICLGALFSINMVLWTSRCNESESIEYMKELMYYLIYSGPGQFVDGTPQLSSMAILHIVVLCCSNIQSRYGAIQMRFDSLDVIRFVELMMLADKGSREKMKDALASWLLEALDKPEDLCLLADRDQRRMTNEIEAAWMRKQLGVKCKDWKRS